MLQWLLCCLIELSIAGSILQDTGLKLIIMNAIKKMMRTLSLPLISVAAMLAMLSACSKTVTVEVPPRVDLSEWPVIGVVEFTSEMNKSLSHEATQKFIMHLQSAQPGVRILELGEHNQLLESVRRTRMDPDAIKVIGDKYGVQAVFTGNLQVAEASPDVSFTRDLSSASAGASIKGALDAKLQETSTGATVWTNGAHGKWSIGGLTFGGKGISDVEYTNPDDKYDEMLKELVEVATNDFRPTYEKRKVDR